MNFSKLKGFCMKTALIADDDLHVRELLRDLVESENIRAIEACNGKECIELYQRFRPDLVVVDIIMPEKDGIRAIKELKRLNERVKIIAISGGLVFTPPIYLDEAKEAGADMSFAKPFENKQFKCAIKDLLELEESSL
jgi:two-component system, chemotaxis family, chemotaxis protein CheY